MLLLLLLLSVDLAPPGTRLNTGDLFKSKTGDDNKRHSNAHQPLTSHSPTGVTIPPPPPFSYSYIYVVGYLSVEDTDTSGSSRAHRIVHATRRTCVVPASQPPQRPGARILQPLATSVDLFRVCESMPSPEILKRVPAFLLVLRRKGVVWSEKRPVCFSDLAPSMPRPA